MDQNSDHTPDSHPHQSSEGEKPHPIQPRPIKVTIKKDILPKPMIGDSHIEEFKDHLKGCVDDWKKTRRILSIKPRFLADQPDPSNPSK